MIFAEFIRFLRIFCGSCVCRQDICCVSRHDICCVSRQDICSMCQQTSPTTTPIHSVQRGGRPSVHNVWEMSWEMSADTTDVLSADTTDVLSADTTDVLSADTFPSENPTCRICQIWHPKNGICPPFGHIGRSPRENFARHTNSVRRTRLWGSQGVGSTLFLENQESDGPGTRFGDGARFWSWGRGEGVSPPCCSSG